MGKMFQNMSCSIEMAQKWPSEQGYLKHPVVDALRVFRVVARRAFRFLRMAGKAIWALLMRLLMTSVAAVITSGENRKIMENHRSRQFISIHINS